MSITTLSTTPQRVPQVSDCGSPAVTALAREEAERRASLLKALADPVRLQLLSIISASPNQEACVCDMTEAVPVSQPTVSHHLKTLVDAGTSPASVGAPGPGSASTPRPLRGSGPSSAERDRRALIGMCGLLRPPRWRAALARWCSP